MKHLSFLLLALSVHSLNAMFSCFSKNKNQTKTSKISHAKTTANSSTTSKAHPSILSKIEGAQNSPRNPSDNRISKRKSRELRSSTKLCQIYALGNQEADY
jgi:hypothetical protein